MEFITKGTLFSSSETEDVYTPSDHFSPNWCVSLFTKDAHHSSMSPRTVVCYASAIRVFFQEVGKRPEHVTKEDIRLFISRAHHEKKLSASSINLMISAYRYFFIKVVGTMKKLELDRPQKYRSLPEILSREEVNTIISASKNLKHKALLSFVYASGLRVSEVVRLELGDLDRERKVVKVRSTNGEKARITLLSDFPSNFLDDYMENLGSPKFLFPGQDSVNPVSVRSVEKIFETSRKKAGIKKKVSIHSLRHAYASHLLDSGTSLRFLQFLLGHKNIQTTQVYTMIPGKRSIANSELNIAV